MVAPMAIMVRAKRESFCGDEDMKFSRNVDLDCTRIRRNHAAASISLRRKKPQVKMFVVLSWIFSKIFKEADGFSKHFPLKGILFESPIGSKNEEIIAQPCLSVFVFCNGIFPKRKTDMVAGKGYAE
jgi:hypothetical protein